ncbi:MAG: tRNA dihydrouridine(20/20a) synthase DusA [Pseudomonadota bacterium]
MTQNPHTFCIAPMMDWTDRHDRYFLRLISRRARLYTEMVVSEAIYHGDRNRLLGFDSVEHPVALQIGGSNPELLAECARIGESWGYDEINLNVGCPSDRVQSGKFGACLIAEPDLVARCVEAMGNAVSIPVTVKTRLGVDDLDNDEHLHGFIRTVSAAGCETFIMHARKAWLSGLSPKENREIPPLQYERVYHLAETFSHLNWVLNGGITTLPDAISHLNTLDGVMLGREAYHNPYCLAEVDQQVFGEQTPTPSRLEILEQLIPYIEARMADGASLKHVTRHILGLFQGQPGARSWRRYLSENAYKPGAGPEVIQYALEAMQQVAKAA